MPVEDGVRRAYLIIQPSDTHLLVQITNGTELYFAAGVIRAAVSERQHLQCLRAEERRRDTVVLKRGSQLYLRTVPITRRRGNRREIARQHCGSRNKTGAVYRGRALRSCLKSREEEEFVFTDWSAQCAAE